MENPNVSVIRSAEINSKIYAHTKHLRRLWLSILLQNTWEGCDCLFFWFMHIQNTWEGCDCLFFWFMHMQNTWEGCDCLFFYKTLEKVVSVCSSDLCTYKTFEKVVIAYSSTKHLRRLWLSILLIYAHTKHLRRLWLSILLQNTWAGCDCLFFYKTLEKVVIVYSSEKWNQGKPKKCLLQRFPIASKTWLHVTAIILHHSL